MTGPTRPLDGPFSTLLASSGLSNLADGVFKVSLPQGVSFLLGRPVLRTLALMVGIANLASSAVFAVLVLYAGGPGSASRLGPSPWLPPAWWRTSSRRRSPGSG